METPQETLQGSPTTLPTTEPGSGSEQVSYTVQTADLPTFSFAVKSQVWLAILFGAGKVATAATISYRMQKNGASVATGTKSVSLNQYYTIGCYFYNVAVADVLTISLWSTQTDSNWDYNAYQIHPSRIIPFNSNLFPYTVNTVGLHPILTVITPSTYTTVLAKFCVISNTYVIAFSTSISIPLIQVDPTYGLFETGYGDATYPNGAGTMSSATLRYFQLNYIPTSISFRNLRL
jgi:hypothetical protein